MRDHRLQQLTKLPNVEVFRDSPMGPEEVLELGVAHVVLATGSRWRRDGVARFHLQPIPIAPAARVLTPDDLMAGSEVNGRVVVFDDDHFYLGGVLAELLVARGCKVALVTPAAEVSTWTRNTMEQQMIQTRLLELGVEIVPHRAVTAVLADGVHTACVFTGRGRDLAADAVVMVTARLPEEILLLGLRQRQEEWAGAGLLSVKAIGDALAPSTIAAAVHGGRRYAEELDAPSRGDSMPFRREVTRLDPGWNDERPVNAANALIPGA